MIVTYDIVVNFSTQGYCSVDLVQRCRCAAIMWLWRWSVTRVQSVGPYNLRLSRLVVTSHHESSRRARGRKERLMKLVSWLTQTTSRMGRSQQTDRQLCQMTASRPCRQN